jgi:hypothetical protein
MTYSVLAGNIIRFFVTFRNDSDVLTNPTAVTIKVGMTDDDAESLTPVSDSTGVYHADWDTTARVAGDYYCKATGSGVLIAAREIRVKIRESNLT